MNGPYKRVMLKLSGEVFGGGKVGVDPDVVAGLAKADDATRERIRSAVLDLAAQAASDGCVRLRSTATVVAGTR